MQSKTDIDQMLAESFKRLARRMPIEKITIKQITDGAGVIRPTFYNHFQDKYELLEWIIRTEILNPAIPTMQSGNLRESMLRIFYRMQQDREFYKKVARLEGQNSCENIAKKFIMEILFTFINEKAGERKLSKKGLTVRLVAEYYAQSMAFVFIQWARLDTGLTPEQMADIFEYITTHSMDDVIAEMN